MNLSGEWYNESVIISKKTTCNVNSADYDITSDIKINHQWMNLFAEQIQKIWDTVESTVHQIPASKDSWDDSCFVYCTLHTNFQADWSCDVCHSSVTMLSSYWSMLGFIKYHWYDALSMWATLCCFLPLIERMCQALST